MGKNFDFGLGWNPARFQTRTVRALFCDRATRAMSRLETAVTIVTLASRLLWDDSKHMDGRKEFKRLINGRPRINLNNVKKVFLSIVGQPAQQLGTCGKKVLVESATRRIVVPDIPRVDRGRFGFSCGCCGEHLRGIETDLSFIRRAVETLIA